MIIIYGEDHCQKCKSAKAKMKIFGLVEGKDYEVHSLSYHITEHSDWRHDNTVALMSFCQYHQTDHIDMPIFKIDDEYYDYAGAMRELKRRRK